MAFSTSCLDKSPFLCPFFLLPKSPLINCLVLCFLCWDTKEEFIERAWNSYPIFCCHGNHRKGQALLLPFSNMDRNTDEKVKTIRAIKSKLSASVCVFLSSILLLPNGLVTQWLFKAQLSAMKHIVKCESSVYVIFNVQCSCNMCDVWAVSFCATCCSL